MKQAEHELGDYAEWPAARRIQLAKDIAAMGYLEESEDTRILSNETAAGQDRVAVADRLMLKLTPFRLLAIVLLLLDMIRLPLKQVCGIRHMMRQRSM